MKILKSISVLLISLMFLAACEENASTIASNPENPDVYISDDMDLAKTLLTEYNAITFEELDETEAAHILFMREEEKLARDVYTLFYEKYNYRVFNNISKSEQAHMNAMKVLIDRYLLIDPVGSNDYGVFVNEDLSNLYIQLIALGDESVIAALQVGAEIEEIDILDLEEAIEDVSGNTDVIFAFNNLKRASGFHLKAFVNVLKFNGVTYTPKHLDEETFNQILGK